MCDVLGEPYVICSEDANGYTKRNRAYWIVNAKLPEKYRDLFTPKTNPNEVMLEGRTLIPYKVNGRESIRPLGKSWRGDPCLN